MKAAELSVRMRRAVGVIDSLIGGRRDCYAAQHVGEDGEVRAHLVKAPLTPDVWGAHVAGTARIGVYPLVDRSRCVWACLDIDVAGDYDAAKKTAGLVVVAANDLGVPIYPERSKGKGVHLWVFFAEVVEAWEARALLRRFCLQAGVKVKGAGKGTEVAIYPPQDELGVDDEVGNLVFAPWFGATVKQGFTAFLDPVTLEPWRDQVGAASEFTRVTSAQVGDLNLDRGNILSLAKKPEADEAAPGPGAEVVRCEPGGMGKLTAAEYKTIGGKLPALRRLIYTPALASYNDWLAGLIHLVPFTNGASIVHTDAFHDPARYNAAETTRKWAEAVKIYSRPDRVAASTSQVLVEHLRVGGRPDVTPISYHYGVQGGKLVRRRYDPGSGAESSPIPLCNFDARVVSVESVVEGVDGEVGSKRMRICVDLQGKAHEFVVAAEDWYGLKSWLSTEMAHTAVIYSAGVKNADTMVLEAIATASMEAPRLRVHCHTGWVGGSYLLSDGAVVGPDLGDDERVDIPVKNLTRYRLPREVTGAAVIEARRWVSELAECAEPHVTAPLIAAMFLAPLASVLSPGFALLLAGKTNSRKSSLVAAALNLLGTGFEHNTLPLSFQDTVNTVERVGFWAKDLPLVIDNYVPDRQKGSANMLHRILHSIGDGAARGRMTGEATIVQGKPFRCLPVITGEDFPVASSDVARAYVVPMTQESVDLARLTRVQDAGAAGLLAPAMTSYLQWLCGKLVDPLWAPALKTRVLGAVRREFAAVRDLHGRVVDQHGWMMLGLELARESFEPWLLKPPAWIPLAVEGLRLNTARRSKMMVGAAVTTRFCEAVGVLFDTGIIHAKDGGVGGPPVNSPGRFGWTLDAFGVPGGLRFPHSAGGCAWVKGEFLMVRPRTLMQYVRGLKDMDARLPESDSAIQNALVSEGFIWVSSGDVTSAERIFGEERHRVWRIHLRAFVRALGIQDDDEKTGFTRLQE